ncbi:MAG: T9SS type A sorting domain-containing protein [Bacteroidales bacterium]
MLVNNQSICILSFSEVTTSVTMKYGNIDLHIYPNPAHDKMLIECSENISSYGIYTTSGKLITSSTLPATEQSPYTIKLPTLSSGLYYLHLQTNKGTIAVLFLKN